MHLASCIAVKIIGANGNILKISQGDAPVGIVYGFSVAVGIGGDLGQVEIVIFDTAGLLNRRNAMDGTAVIGCSVCVAVKEVVGDSQIQGLIGSSPGKINLGRRGAPGEMEAVDH